MDDMHPNPGYEDRSARPLGYATGLPWHRRRSLHRRLILVSLLLCGIFAWPLGRSAWRNAQAVYWQRQCLVFDVGHRLPVASLGQKIAAVIDPVPVAWQQLSGIALAPGIISHGTAFLHARHTPDGRRRLVAVDVVDLSVNGLPELALHARVIRPGTFWSSPRECYGPSSGAVWAFPGMSAVYAGTAGPHHARHFTIPIHMNGRDTLLDGWLDNDGRVILELRREELADFEPMR
jgi:hypothetical protein